MPVPLVTGISPAEGSPGTMVKIRGENLGRNANDLVGVFICKVNCTYTADWHSSYIMCRTGMGLGVGDIIVVTNSGGIGSSMVKFRGFMPRVGLLTASAVWVDESKLFEEKPTASGIPTSRSMSPTMLSVDPLGVAPAETGNLLPADKIEEMYPNCSGNTLAENFHPARFLLERHLDTSFDALKSGYVHLESHDTRSSSAGPSSFIRKNLGTILESLDTLAAIKKTMIEDEKASNSTSICAEMEGILENCNSAAFNMFQDILTRKDEADVKRNAVNVLQRFKFLFSLQKNIDRKIQQGDYEIVISDYNRAKAFIQNTEVKCFRKVLKEVDARISTFMAQLCTKLFEFPSTLEEQKRVIRYLNDLDYAGDPAWECIDKMYQWMTKLFLSCKEELQKSETSAKLMSPPSSTMDIRAIRSDTRLEQYPTFQGHSRSSSDGGKTNSGLQQVSKKKSHSRAGSGQGSMSEISFAGSLESTPPSRVLFILRLCDLVVTNMPDFWKLGQAYLSGQLRKKVTQSSTEEEHAKNENRFSGKVKSVLRLFDGLVRAVFQPESLAHLGEADKAKFGGWYNAQVPLVPWLPKCARMIRSCLDSLKSINIPSELLAPVRKLSTDICSVSVHEVLQSTVADVKALHTKEDWELDYDDENNCISLLPGFFKKMLIDSLHFVKEFMAETKIDSKQDQSLKLKEQVSESLKKMVKAFIDTLLIVLGDHLQQEAVKGESGSLPVISSTSSTLSTALSLEERLLILLSNTSYLRSSLLPTLGTKCREFGYDELETLSQMFKDELGKLESEVLATYIEIKGEPLVGSIEQGMSLGEYRWDEDIPITGVRAYVREVILTLVVIHDQVSSISFSYVPIVFAKLGDILSEEIRRIFECQRFSLNGTIQGHLELSVFESALAQYLTDAAKESFSGARKVLPSLRNESSRVVEELVGKFNKEMSCQLSCFTLVEPAHEDLTVESVEETNPFLAADEEQESFERARPKILAHTPEEKAGRTSEEKKTATPKSNLSKSQGKSKAPTPPKVKEEAKLSTPGKGKAPSPPKSKAIAPTPPKAKTVATTPPRSATVTVSKSKGRAPSPPMATPVSNEKRDPPSQSAAPAPPITQEASNPFLDDSDEEEMTSGNTNPFLD